MVGSQVYNGNINTIDGCATFFRRDRFSHVKKYEVRIWFYVCSSTFKFVHYNYCLLACRLSLIRLHSL